ncbi:MAG: LysR family transcriptional regulator [Betaproteobacteria bacterium]
MNEVDLRRIDLNLLVVFDVLMAERSVTRAAARLHRTQSAVSHALARLRAQLGDPVLVRTAGGMRASPFAEALIAEVRPILRSVQRVLTPPAAFNPAESARVFRLALPDVAPSLFPRLCGVVLAAAPRATLEWIPHGPATLLAGAEGQADAALVPAALPLPEGVAGDDAGAIGWATFMRADHPARAHWSSRSWPRWGHVVVQMGDRLTSPVDSSLRTSRPRRVVARVPHFAAVGPLLTCTDAIATLPRVAMAEAMALYRLTAVRAPAALAPMPHRIVYSARLAGDPANRWIRERLGAVWSAVRDEADALVAA